MLGEEGVEGDLAFQARCAETIRAMRAEGTTLVLASHDLALVERECEHALWLDHGEARMLGPAGDVVAAYREAAHARVVEATPAPAALGGRLELRRDRVGTQQLTIDSVAVEPALVGRGDRLAFRLELSNHGEPVTDPIVELKVAREDDDALCFHTTTRDSGVALGRVLGGWQAKRAAIYSSVSFAVVILLYVAFRVAETNAGGRFL